MQMPFSIRPPKREHAPVIHDGSDTWMAYPFSSPPVPAHRYCVHNQSFELHLIVYDVVQFYVPAEQDEQLLNTLSYAELETVVNSFHSRFTSWRQQLPECVKEGQTWTPAVVLLQCVYL
jgi:hypothetical protein